MTLHVIEGQLFAPEKNASIVAHLKRVQRGNGRSARKPERFEPIAYYNPHWPLLNEHIPIEPLRQDPRTEEVRYADILLHEGTRLRHAGSQRDSELTVEHEVPLWFKLNILDKIKLLAPAQGEDAGCERSTAIRSSKSR